MQKEDKGAWKHVWEPVGEAMEIRDTAGKRGYRRKYACRVCGVEITARCSSRIRTSVWKKQGVQECRLELVDAVHNL